MPHARSLMVNVDVYKLATTSQLHLRSLSARLVVCVNPNQLSNTSRTRSDSPHRDSVPSVNFANYSGWNVPVTRMCGLRLTLIASVSPTSWARFWAGFLHGEVWLPRYPSPYRCKHRFAENTPAPQADGLGFGRLATSRPD